MRLLICGDRNWTNKHAIKREVNKLLQRNTIEVIISGTARGADSLGEQCASDLGIPTMRFPALWDNYGKAAGPIRNQQMLDEGTPDLVLAFHADLGHSKGTYDMIKRCIKHGVQYLVIKE